MIEIEIDVPDDWHVHLRDDDMLVTVAPFTASTFRHALVMPNLVPPVTSTAMAAGYRARILEAAGAAARRDFTPLMALYLNDSLETADLLAGHAAGLVLAAKYYPAGATTNSDQGGAALMGYRSTLEAMADAGIALLVHAESTDPDIDIFDREAAFLETELAPVCEAIPALKVTVEHISTRSGLDFVRSRRGVAGSITPHHLTCDRSDVLANGLRPDLYCKPVINSRDERIALVAAATSGDPSFFYGTDSAPHPWSNKATGSAKPGVFNAPYALEVVAELFHTEGALGQLEGFVSHHGVDHYGLGRASSRIRLWRDESADFEPSAAVATPDGDEVRIFGVDAAKRWRWEPVDN